MCPTRVIVRDDDGYPEVDFTRGACTFCGKCAVACKTGALDRPTPAAKPWNLVANIDGTCLAMNRIECRVCGERCETGAIRLELAVGAVARPVVVAEDCSGCGACKKDCPASAIRMDQVTEAVPA